MGIFKVKAITDLKEVKSTDKLEESDYSIVTQDNKFIQFEYLEDEDRKAIPYTVKAGIWSIQAAMSGMFLQETSFNADKLLESYSFSKEISDKIRIFFSKFESYIKRGALPIRKFLLYGPGGSGKTSAIVAAIEEYSKDGKTAIILWHTDKFEAFKVKDFLQTFDYVDVEKVIFVVEDIGGFEIDEGKMRSDSSLLSLLDNKEKTFKIPTLLIATTNHPEIFLGNLMNRPGRFSDKIEVSFPKGPERLNLLKFFYKEELSEKTIELITSDKTSTFTPDHIKHFIENADLYGKSLDEAIEDMISEIAFFNKAFSKGKAMGAFYDE